MSVARCREINARLRAAGVTVHESPGWESRGNGQTSDYVGGIVHHTATAFGNAVPTTGVYKLLVDGRSDLRGPLCNYAGNEDGSLTVIAANPANHAGSGNGRSMGPLPVTSSFNRRVLGLEIVYPGTVPMRDAQYRAARIWARVVADVVGGGDIQRIRAHAETSTTGKWDPGDAPGRTINMAAFRAAALVTPEDDMPTVNEILMGGVTGKDPATGQQETHPFAEWFTAMAYRTRDVHQQVPALIAAVSAATNDPDINPELLGALIDQSVAEHTPSAQEVAEAQRPFLTDVIRSALGEDNADQANAIVDELVSRLANPAPEGN